MKIKGVFLAMILWTITMVPLSAQLTVGGFMNFNIAGLNVNPAGTGEDYSSYLGFGLGDILP